MQACKKALEEANGDEPKAIELLRKKGEAKAVERSSRNTGEGVVATYIHSNGKLGVLLQLGCETDFVARNQDFQGLAKDIAMHAAAMNPLYTAPSEVPHELVEKEREIWKSQLAKEGKPEKMIDKIMIGKLNKFYEEVCLVKQEYIKDDEKKVQDILGEVKVEKFIRYSL